MPYIPLEEHLPGITGLLEYRKDTAAPIRELTQFLLRGPSTLTEGERELIATIVSHRNQCKFCVTAHTAAADLLLGENNTTQKIKENDREIHDTVLIAATFSMFNRYVDGLASFTPTDPEEYKAMGERMATKGYIMPQQTT